NGLKLRWRKAFLDAIGQQQDRPPDSDDARLQKPRRLARLHGRSYLERSAGAHRRPDVAPAPQPHQSYGSESARPCAKNYSASPVAMPLRGEGRNIGERLAYLDERRHGSGQGWPGYVPFHPAAEHGQQRERDQEFDRRAEPEPVPDRSPVLAQRKGQQRRRERERGRLPEMISHFFFAASF